MPRDRYLLPCDKSGRPVQVGQLLWSSEATPWSGFRVEAYRSAEHMHIGGPVEASAHIAMCLSGISKMEMRAGKTERRSISTSGALVLSSRGFKYDSMSWSGSTDVVIVELDLARIGAAANDGYFPAELAPSYQFFIRDPHLTAFLLRMMTEVNGGCPAGRIYGESISLALGAYVLGRYMDRAIDQKQAKAKLTSKQIAKIQDYVRARLSRDLSIHELADIVNLSAPHFAQLFKNTTELTPHQFVIRERIIESLRLLSSGRMCIAEIAQETGFADQSHFTTVFKKVTQATPKQFRLARRHFKVGD